MKTLSYIIENGKRIKTPTPLYDSYHQTVWIAGKIPKYHYDNAVWSYDGRKRKLISKASGVLYVPRDSRLVIIGGVDTIVPKDYLSKVCVECYWTDPSRGYSIKLVKGFLHVKTSTHGKTRKKVLTGALLKKRADRAARIASSEFDELASKCTRIVSPYQISRSVGNCSVGTNRFLDKLFENCKNRPKELAVNVIWRLARIKRMSCNMDFKRATKMALV